MQIITTILKSLGEQRPVFHSEADFQHAFAWELQRRLPGAALRLERPFSPINNQIHLDVLALHDNAIFAIELKYKTSRLSVGLAGESFTLRDHSAQDCGRYDFIKDICRVEQIVANAANVTGFAILLTNDSSYWKIGTARTVDRDFRIHDGCTLHGTLKWGDNAGTGTMNGRENPLEIKGTYKIHWQDYSCPSSGAHGKFRYAIVKTGGE